MQEYIGVLMRRLQSQIHAGWGCGVVDLVDWYSWTTFDIVGELGFGETFGCLSSPMHHDWSAMVFSHFRASALVTSVKFYPYLENVLRWFLPRDVSNRQNHFQKSREKVHRRLRDANTTKVDFMSYVLDQKLEERMSLKEIETTFNILVIAGSETTASALVGTTGFLLRNPACMATLVKEIRGAFDEEKDITLAAVGRLSYLSAVIEEGLRMGPPVPSGLPRVVPAAGAYVCDKWIPGGVCPPIFLLRLDIIADTVSRQTYPSTNGRPIVHQPTFHDPMSSFPSAGSAQSKPPRPFQMIVNPLSSLSHLVRATALARTLHMQS